MDQKNSMKETVVGTSGSILSGVGLAAGACCAGPGGAACGSVCAPACGAAAGSIFGLSSSGVASLASSLMPVFMVISAVAFTASYFKLFKSGNDCETDPSDKSIKGHIARNQKPIFWGSLLFTIAMYGYAMVPAAGAEEACCDSSSPTTELTSDCKK